MQASRAAKNETYRKLGKWKYVSAPKMKGAFGETDYEKKTIKINKKLSRQAAKTKKGAWKKYGMSKKDTSVINSIVHEKLHKNHPKMLEGTVRKKAHKLVSKMGRKAKAKLYSKFS